MSSPQRKRRDAADREYRKLRDAFLEANIVCQAKVPNICGLLSSQVHHKRGRVGSDYLDTSLYLAVCLRCHEYIETHRTEAIERGWALRRIARAARSPRVGGAL